MRTAIDLPELDKKQVQAYYAQMRPTREGGNRLAKVNLNGKCVVHNYGHGGAGVSLAPGSAIEAIKLAKEELKTQQINVAVVGSGIIGLMNALQLSSQYPFAKITIYSQRIPNFGQKDNNKMITSQIAPGYWLPYGYGHTDQKLHEHLSTLSFNYYNSMKELPEYKACLKEVEVYDISDEIFRKDTFKVLTKQLKESVQNIKVKLNDKTTVDCMYFKTIKIDMQPFLHSLILTLQKRNVLFIAKKIQSKDFSELNESIIFNCAGLGSKQLIDDKLMKGVKGHLIEYKNPNPEKFNYFIKTNVGNQAIRYYMHDSRILLGLTRQNQEDSIVDASKIELLQSSHQQVLQKFGIVPLKPKF